MNYQTGMLHVHVYLKCCFDSIAGYDKSMQYPLSYSPSGKAKLQVSSTVVRRFPTLSDSFLTFSDIFRHLMILHTIITGRVSTGQLVGQQHRRTHTGLLYINVIISLLPGHKGVYDNLMLYSQSHQPRNNRNLGL